MTEFKTFNKTITILLILTMSIFLLIGCNNKNTSNYQNSTKKLTEKKIDKDLIKKNYEGVLEKLVSDSIITKNQSNKILTALMGTVNNGNEESIEKQNNALNKLVSDGVITRHQADKVMDALRKK